MKGEERNRRLRGWRGTGEIKRGREKREIEGGRRGKKI